MNWNNIMPARYLEGATDPDAIADVELRTGQCLEAYSILEKPMGYQIGTRIGKKKFYDHWSVLEINYRGKS